MIETATLILVAIVVLSVIVLVHEFGHFIVAKKLGVWVEEFGLGLPPKIWSKKFGETVYSINALPIGGFVKLHGETGDGKVKYPFRAFANKSKLSRVAIALAGIGMNFLLAVVSFSVFYSFAGIVRPREGDVRVVEIAPGSPAQVVGVLVDDVLYKVDGDEIKTTDSFITKVGAKKGKRISLEVKRNENGSEVFKKFSLTPRENPPEGEGSLGVTIAGIEPEIYYPPIFQRPFVGAYYGIKSTIDFSRDVLLGFAKISQDIGGGRAPEGVVGPVGIFALISEIAKNGILPVINLVGIISLNLAIFNLIPFPPLDGSRVLFVILENFVSKKWLPKIEAVAHSAGMIVLLILLFLISGREIPTLLKAGSLQGFVEGMIK